MNTDQSQMEIPSAEVPNEIPPPPRKKRVLTEAQRLAFIKGREKRMMNIEKRRQAKLEAQAMEEPPAVVTPEPEPKVIEPEIPAMPKIVRQTNQAVDVKPNIDEAGAKMIAQYVIDQLGSPVVQLPQSPTHKKRRYRQRVKSQPVEVEPVQGVQAPVIKTFNWM